MFKYFNEFSFNIDEKQWRAEIHDTVDNELNMFSWAYFGKSLKELTPEENHELDCFGSFGASLWLDDHPDEIYQIKDKI